MSATKNSQYQAYSLATRTVAKTRQVVMLYDGAIRFIKQAQMAISDKRIEDRFRYLSRASDVMAGLQNSIDFDKGGEVAMTLHRFYITMCTRILAINFNPRDSYALCESVISELKEMREVWNAIDLTLNTTGEAIPMPAAPDIAVSSSSAGVTLSA